MGKSLSNRHQFRRLIFSFPLSCWRGLGGGRNIIIIIIMMIIIIITIMNSKTGIFRGLTQNETQPAMKCNCSTSQQSQATDVDREENQNIDDVGTVTCSISVYPNLKDFQILNNNPSLSFTTFGSISAASSQGLGPKSPSPSSTPCFFGAPNEASESRLAMLGNCCDQDFQAWIILPRPTAVWTGETTSTFWES